LNNIRPKENPVVVVGSGAGGLPAAVAIAESGRHVIVLERGDRYRPSMSRTDQYDFETKALPWTTGNEEWQGPMQVQRALGLGGTSLYFQGLMQMPPASVLADWGLAPQPLERTTREIERFIQIAGSEQPAHRLNPGSQKLLDTARKIGWRAREAPLAILSRAHDERPPCNYCGQCVFGCKPRDKGSVDNTWLPRAVKTGRVKILTNARVESIGLSSATRAGSVNFVTDNGHQRLELSALVVAAGTLETPYLLKASQQANAPSGIGNKHVGRNLRGSILYSHLVALPEATLGYAGPPIDILIDEFEQDGLLLCQGRNLGGITGPVSLAKLYARNFGAVGLRQWMRTYYEKIAVLAGFAETQGDFRFGIGNTKKKEFSLSMSDGDLKKVKELKKVIAIWGNNAQASVLMDSPVENASVSGAMLRGTCQLGPDEKKSAVTPEGLLRGYDNIVISDASILGAGLIAHPSLPLQVLGSLFGTRLAQRLLS